MSYGAIRTDDDDDDEHGVLGVVKFSLAHPGFNLVCANSKSGLKRHRKSSTKFSTNLACGYSEFFRTQL